MDKTDIPMSIILDYEIRSSWWAGYIGWSWGQSLAAKYFVWKAKRKYTRWKNSLLWQQLTNTLDSVER